MGFGGISIWQILIILLIVVLLFGTKKLRNVGGDLGAAIKNFKKSVREGEADAEAEAKDEHKQVENAEGRVIDAEVERKEQKKA